jgi:uncharacterized repeat protein (TIGR01451 family)
VALDSGEEQTASGEIKGGVLVPGRLYVATEAGLLFAIGDSHAVADATSKEPSTDSETPQAGTEGEDQQVVPVTPVPTPAPTTIPSESVIAGGTLTYTIPIINRGPSDAPGVILTDTLPAGVTFVAATSSQGAGCSESGGAVVCDLDYLPNGASATITIVVTVDPTTTGTVTHTTAVISQASDPDTVDNQLDRPATVRGAADLGVAQLVAPDPAIAGRPLTYTLNILNSGPADATDVTIISRPPPGTTFISACSEQELNCTESNGTVTCELGDLPNGVSASVAIRVTVDPSATGTIVHSVTVVAREPDFDLLGNTAVNETPVNAEADLTITR